MCTNYKSPEVLDIERAWSLIPRDQRHWEPEIWPDRPAPIIRQGAEGPECVVANFRLIPFQAKDPKGFKAATMNARIETVDQLFSFKHAWQRSQRCVIPAWAFYEPLYTSAASRSERWQIGAADGTMLSIGGIWDRWCGADGDEWLSFAMLTLNCDAHPLLKRFHKWFDAKGDPEEKRTPVLLRDDEVGAWLSGDTDTARALCKSWPEEELVAAPAPLPRAPAKVAKPKPSQEDLFS